MIRLVLYVCISISGADDPHTYSGATIGEGVGHVAYSYSTSFIDLKRQSADECEAFHGETCESMCYESRILDDAKSQ